MLELEYSNGFDADILEQLVGIALHNVAKWSLAILTAPYYLLFWRYHKGTIDEALSLGSDEAMAQRVFDWLNIKRREAIFIQAAVSPTMIVLLCIRLSSEGSSYFCLYC